MSSETKVALNADYFSKKTKVVCTVSDSTDLVVVI
jgi:hypothetical protein